MSRNTKLDPTTHIAALVITLGAALTLLSVLWLTPRHENPRDVATQTLIAAREASQSDLTAEVTQVLPPGTRAVISGPDPASADTPSGESTSSAAPPADSVAPLAPHARVTVLDSSAQRANVLDQLSQKGAVATASDGTWWVAITDQQGGSQLPAALTPALITLATGGLAVGFTTSSGASRLTDATGGLTQTPLNPHAPQLDTTSPKTRPQAYGPTVVGTNVGDLGEQRDLLLNCRATLVRGLADLLPQMPDQLSWQAKNMLEAAGVTMVDPGGQPIDPKVHQVVGTERTTNPALDDIVARTVRPGFADGQEIIVPPRVVVYASETTR